MQLLRDNLTLWTSSDQEDVTVDDYDQEEWSTWLKLGDFMYKSLSYKKKQTKHLYFPVSYLSEN